jgi:hypothetical protein
MGEIGLVIEAGRFYRTRAGERVYCGYWDATNRNG